jgi:CRP-like cAMP-binding protein
MELTLDSALSSGAMVGHFAYVLAVVSMLMRNISWLRIFYIIATLIGIFYVIFWVKDPVALFWETILLFVNLYQLAILEWRNFWAKFSSEDQDFIKDKFKSLPKGHARILLNGGNWKTVEDQEILTIENQASSHLSYIAKGNVDIIVNDKKLLVAGPSNYIGEMTVLSREPASATVIANGPVRVWQIEAKKLQTIIDNYSDIGLALDASFARNYREKLKQANLRVMNANNKASATNKDSHQS